MLTPLPKEKAFSHSIPSGLLVSQIFTYSEARRHAIKVAKSSKALRTITLICMRHDDEIQLIEFGRRGGVKKIHHVWGKPTSPNSIIQ